jgi:hypothetical protein
VREIIFLQSARALNAVPTMAHPMLRLILFSLVSPFWNGDRFAELRAGFQCAFE